MRPSRSSDHTWLSFRIRLLCLSTFAVSLFLPPYIPDIATAPPPELEIDARGFLMAEEGFLMKTSALTEIGTRSAFGQGVIHTVESGESLGSIAKLSFLSTDTIRWANSMGPKDSVKPGQKLLILPVDGIIHTVKRGQNLKTISDLYGVKSDVIAEQNALKGGYLLAGQDLIVPGGKPIVEAPKPPLVATVKAPAKPLATVPNTKVDFPEAKSYTIEPSYGILQMPCDCFYTQYFGKSHFGIDLQHRGGSPIFAAEAGTVIRADYGWNGGYGNVIEVDHGNGLITLYAHNKTLYVKKGDEVTRGMPIAFMGNTGRVHGPTGIHLHFEIHVNGIKKNPGVYLQQ